MFGNLETAQFLLAFSPTVDPSACGNFSIITASYKGYVDIVQFLLQDPRVDPSVLFANHNGVISRNLFEWTFGSSELLLADARINLDPTESLAVQCLGVACANGHLPLAQFLVELGVCPEGNDNYAVLVACVEGQTEIVKYLLGDHRVNPSCRSNLPIQKAAQFGHLDIVNLLLARKDVDPSDIQNKAIRLAAFRRNHHIVERLLQHPLVDPSDYNNEAIRIASQKGDHRTVAALLRDKRVNPSVNDNEAFHSCCIIPNQAANDDERPAPDISDYVKVMTLLAKDSRFKADKKVYKVLKPFYDATVDDE
ncbi:ankyrin repeat-containing domain protein [Obelidium mucronatum]|nr:ankyrin repeat-containing domain protein [Obelidium mucronatum]